MLEMPHMAEVPQKQQPEPVQEKARNRSRANTWHPLSGFFWSL